MERRRCELRLQDPLRQRREGRRDRHPVRLAGEHPEAAIGGNADIPGFQLVKNAAENKDLQSAIDDGTLTVTLSTKLRMSKDADYSSESEDTIASFTSRGIHGSYDGTAKPDVSAPGVGIVSASAGTGNSDEIMSGTSMATPLTSGVAALVRQARPEYLANVVKAQLMNTRQPRRAHRGSQDRVRPAACGLRSYRRARRSEQQRAACRRG